MEAFLFITAGICLVLSLITFVPMLTNTRRRIAAVLLLVGVACLLGGIYLYATSDRITTKNVDSKVKQWLDTFNIVSGTVPDPNAYFNYQLTGRLDIPQQPRTKTVPTTVARDKAHPQDLTIATKMELAQEDAQIYNKLSEDQRTELLMQLGLELAKAKISTIPDFSNGFGLTIMSHVPITPDLTEAVFFNKLAEVDFGFIIANNAIELFLARFKSPQPSAIQLPRPASKHDR